MRRIALKLRNHIARFFASGQIRGDERFRFAPENGYAVRFGLGAQTHADDRGQHKEAHRGENDGDIERHAQDVWS